MKDLDSIASVDKMNESPKSSKINAVVLIVEDNLLTSFHIKTILERKGYKNVMITKSGEEAIEIAHKHDVVLYFMDISLAGDLSGLDAARTIRTFSQAPILFISALTDEETVDSIHAVENSLHEPKPFKEHNLLDFASKAYPNQLN